MADWPKEKRQTHQIKLQAGRPHRAGFGDADLEQHFEIRSVDSEQVSIECRRRCEELATEQSGAVQQREHRGTRDILSTGTSFRRRCQCQEGGREARECCNNTQNFRSRCSCSQGAKDPTLYRLQDDCDKQMMMDQARICKLWVCMLRKKWRRGTHVHRLGMNTWRRRSVQMKRS